MVLAAAETPGLVQIVTEVVPYVKNHDGFNQSFFFIYISMLKLTFEAENV